MCGPGPCSECGDINRPPSRGNMSLIAIIELVIMGVVGVVCLIDLYDLIKYMNDDHDWKVFEILRVVEYCLIVAGLVFIIIGLFCSPSQRQIYTGIICFLIGTILAIILTVLVIKDDKGEDSLAYNICYIILLVFLAWILWKQSYHL